MTTSVLAENGTKTAIMPRWLVAIRFGSAPLPLCFSSAHWLAPEEGTRKKNVKLAEEDQASSFRISSQEGKSTGFEKENDEYTCSIRENCSRSSKLSLAIKKTTAMRLLPVWRGRERSYHTIELRNAATHWRSICAAHVCQDLENSYCIWKSSCLAWGGKKYICPGEPTVGTRTDQICCYSCSYWVYLQPKFCNWQRVINCFRCDELITSENNACVTSPWGAFSQDVLFWILNRVHGLLPFITLITSVNISPLRTNQCIICHGEKHIIIGVWWVGVGHLIVPFFIKRRCCCCLSARRPLFSRIMIASSTLRYMLCYLIWTSHDTHMRAATGTYTYWEQDVGVLFLRDRILKHSLCCITKSVYEIILNGNDGIKPLIAWDCDLWGYRSCRGRFHDQIGSSVRWDRWGTDVSWNFAVAVPTTLSKSRDHVTMDECVLSRRTSPSAVVRFSHYSIFNLSSLLPLLISKIRSWLRINIRSSSLVPRLWYQNVCFTDPAPIHIPNLMEYADPWLNIWP